MHSAMDVRNVGRKKSAHVHEQALVRLEKLSGRQTRPPDVRQHSEHSATKNELSNHRGNYAWE